ncbi:DUF1800 domain-containing protein [Neosynechococcus sphagnicola]|uniref:DUF1800 domain-containing protein n=1 Tax=Neosynechococcus sphagnicola TaxID=1501145 RepID=UPI003083F54A
MAIAQQYLPPRPPQGQKPDPEVVKAAKQRYRILVEQSAQSRLLRASESPRQLQEVMVDFWFNHFNVFANKGLTRLWVGSYEASVIRPQSLGNFRQLLGATARHPAMLFYLDNWLNTAPDSPGARGRLKGLNENYARELMELHTLGVNGGYTQQDVVTLARILTGWGLCQDFGRQLAAIADPSGFCFDSRRHDFSDKVFLGQRIKGSGIAEGEQALDILARSPATAHHLSYQLAQYFVADQPPAALVDRLAQRFIDTHGNIQAVLNTLFHSPEFWDTKYYNAKFKTPYQYVVSALRATDVSVQNLRPILGTLQQLGMPLYGCQTPDGYKNTQAAWLNPDAMTRRLSFATALASGRLPLNQVPVNPDTPLLPTPTMPPAMGVPSPQSGQTIDPQQLRITLGNPFTTQTQAAIANSPASLRAALMLGSPEFMRR